MASGSVDIPIPVNRPWLPPFEEFAALARDIFERRYISNFGKYSELLEERAGAALGRDVLSVTSCDIGMTLAWRALGLASGEVIVPSFTFASTVNAIVWNGLTPVFADIDPNTLCVDPASVEKLLSPATVGLAAVHIFGEPVSPEIDHIAAAEGLVLVFDAAHAIGTTVNGNSLAARGDATVFSLSGTKVATAGEGGLAAFRDSDTRQRFRELRGYGFIGDYNVKATGLNGKMSELDAALGYLSFGMLDDVVARRAKVAAKYRRRLNGRHGLRLQPEPPPGDTRSYKDFSVVFPNAAARAAVVSALTRRRVGTKRYFLPVHTMAAYRGIAPRASLPVTEDIWERALCIPMFYDLSDEQVDYVADTIEDTVAAASEARTR